MTTEESSAVVRAIDALREDVAELRAAVVASAARRESCMARFEKIERALFGNGQPGLCQRLDRMEAVETHSLTWRLMLVSGLVGFVGACAAGLLVAWIV